MKHAMIGITAFVVWAWSGGALAEEAAVKENLAACKLPHGEVLLPDRNTPEAHTGYILRFSDGAVNPNPKVEGKQPESTRDILDLWRSRKTGDLIYSPLENGSFLAISGRISDLGSHLLSEMSGRRFDRPSPVQSVKSRSGGEPEPGVLEGVEDGHCYLAETLEGKFALVRLVQKQGRYALIQYVYQPTGEPAFEIPKGETIKVQPPRPTPKPEDLIPPPPASVPGKVTDVPTLLEIREKMIGSLIATVKKPARTKQEILAKVQAVHALGTLRAAEAVPTLLQEIAFADPYVLMLEFILAKAFPCVGALQSIGKPASLAAIDAIEQLRLNGSPQQVSSSSPKYQLMMLLVEVVRGVEGLDVARFMISARMKQASDESRQAYELALKILGD